MTTEISDGAQFHAAAVLTAPAGPHVTPDRSPEESGKRETVHRAAVRESETDAKPEDTDRGLRAADRLLADLSDASVGVTFVRVDGIDDPVIRVVNRETGEIVRQIPPDEVLELKKRFAELLGMFKDLKA